MAVAVSSRPYSSCPVSGSTTAAMTRDPTRVLEHRLNGGRDAGGRRQRRIAGKTGQQPPQRAEVPVMRLLQRSRGSPPLDRSGAAPKPPRTIAAPTAARITAYALASCLQCRRQCDSYETLGQPSRGWRTRGVRRRDEIPKVSATSTRWTITLGDPAGPHALHRDAVPRRLRLRRRHPWSGRGPARRAGLAAGTDVSRLHHPGARDRDVPDDRREGPDDKVLVPATGIRGRSICATSTTSLSSSERRSNTSSASIRTWSPASPSRARPGRRRSRSRDRGVPKTTAGAGRGRASGRRNSLRLKDLRVSASRFANVRAAAARACARTADTPARGIAMTRRLAAAADRMPLLESSMAAHVAGSWPRSRATASYTSGAGFPRATSSVDRVAGTAPPNRSAPRPDR